MKDVLGALANRFKVLRLGGGGLFLSRLARATARPIVIRSVVKYSQNWVKSQSRMASNSNQETFRCDNIDGRVVFDILRQVCGLEAGVTSPVSMNQRLSRRVVQLACPEWPPVLLSMTSCVRHMWLTRHVSMHSSDKKQALARHTQLVMLMTVAAAVLICS